jgi:F-type H+-transporting ATPase subunit b
MKKYLLPALFALATGPVAMAAEEGEASVFAGTVAQSIAAVIVFLLLFAFLYRKAWGPILTGLQEREAKIKGDLEQAEAASKKAAATLADYQKQLATAREESARIMENGRREAEKTAVRLQSETQNEIDAMKKRAAAEINYAKEQALADIFAQAATLGSDIAGKILRREINPADQQRLVQESLATLKKEDLT